MASHWKKGRGKLGLFAPLHGCWLAEADSERGPLRCHRSLQPALGGSFLRLEVRWEFSGAAAGQGYEELALIGLGEDGRPAYWSYTSDGKRSEGRLADVTDIHPEAIGFEARMPAGLARQAYWPAEGGGFHWAVEARNQKGWKRFTEHRYLAAPAAG